MRNETIIITRQQVGSIGGVIGVIGIVAGVIGWLWAGYLTPLVGALLISGVIGLALWAVMTPREFTAFITGRGVRFGTLTAFSLILLIGVVAMIYILIARATLTLDLTVNQAYTLSRETEAVLNRVSRPIQLTGFYTSRSLTDREIDDQFFRLYESDSNGLISRVYIDPDEQRAVAQQFGVTNDQQLYISFLNPDGTVDFSTLARVPRSGSQERDISEAIARLLISGSLRIYFSDGLGERNLVDTTQEGISGIFYGVQESGVLAAPLDIRELAEAGEDVPADAAALVFARPLSDLNDAEIALIDRYLNRGGALFLMAEALFTSNSFLRHDGAFNTYLWDNYGIRTLDAVVVETPGVSGQTPLDIIGAYVYTNSPIAQRLDPEEYPLFFSLARALEVNFDALPPDVANGQVVISSEGSYGETDLQALAQTNTFTYDESEDLLPPLATVVWATNQRNNSRILLVGDSSFVSNGAVLIGGNGILFTDGLAWLIEFDEQIAFAPRAFSATLPLVFADGATINTITFVTVILLPGAVLVAGFAIWARRVRR